MNRNTKILISMMLVLALGIFLTGCDTSLLESPTTILQIEIEGEGEGEVNPEAGTHSFTEDAQVELTAVPAEGSKFVEWRGDGIVVSNKGNGETTTTIIMDRNRTVKAIFEISSDNDNNENNNDNNTDEKNNESEETGKLVAVDIYNQVVDIQVPFGTSEEEAEAKLVSEIGVRDSLGKEYVVQLDWSIADYQAEVPDDYNATGTFDFPEGAELAEVTPAVIPFPEPEVTAIVTVMPEPEPGPAISITKSASPTTYSYVGQEIEYTLLVENTGDVTLSDVLVEDEFLELSENIGDLEPGETQEIKTSYIITLADLNEGSIYNTAFVTGYYQEEEVSDDDDATIYAEYEPNISLTKTALTDFYYSIGDVIDYEILITNTGNVTLYNVTVVDTIAVFNNGENGSIDIGTLDPGESQTVTAYYVIVQGDLERGYVENTATVTGEDKAGTEVSDDDTAVVEPHFDPMECETAWAYDADYASTFQELNISQKWGWSNGPLAPEGEYVFDLYAAAGQNDLGKGTLVGTLTVSFSDEEVIYMLKVNYTLHEVHLYLSNEQLKNAAPGQLGYTGEEINEGEYVISFSEFTDVDFSKDIYVAAHAVVCFEQAK